MLFLSISQDIGWEKHLENYLLVFYVVWDVKNLNTVNRLSVVVVVVVVVVVHTQTSALWPSEPCWDYPGESVPER